MPVAAVPPPPLEVRHETDSDIPRFVDAEPQPHGAVQPRAAAGIAPWRANDDFAFTPGSTVAVAPSTRSSTSNSRGFGNPRSRVLLCYAVPFAPALALLVRERRNAFVRLHAARALAFFGAIVIAQSVLFVALVLIGGFVGNGFAAFAFGLLFYGLFGVLGLTAVGVWLRLLADAAAGTLTHVPLLTTAAWRIEWAFARVQGLPG